MTDLLSRAKALLHHHFTEEGLGRGASFVPSSPSSPVQVPVTRRVDAYSKVLPKLALINETKTSQLLSQAQEYLSKYKINSNISLPSPPCSPQHSPSPSSAQAVLKPTEEHSDGLYPFLRQAYKWLTDNVHNPYPPLTTKRKMAFENGVTMNVVNNWFTNVRRRMGWSRISIKYFNGDRARILESAHQVFVTQTMDLLDESLVHEFLAMKAFVEKSYQDKYGESEATKKITELFRNAASLSSQSDGTPVLASVLTDTSEGVGSRHSPTISPNHTALQLRLLKRPIVDSSVVKSVSLPSSNPIDAMMRPRKRLRKECSPIEKSVSETTSFVPDNLNPHPLHPEIPQTTASHAGLFLPTVLPLPQTPKFPSHATQAQSSNHPPFSKKRRLSESETIQPYGPKRPRNTLAVPRPQAVSDPLVHQPLNGVFIDGLCPTSGQEGCDYLLDKIDTVEGVFDWDTSNFAQTLLNNPQQWHSLDPQPAVDPAKQLFSVTPDYEYSDHPIADTPKDGSLILAEIPSLEDQFPFTLGDNPSASLTDELMMLGSYLNPNFSADFSQTFRPLFSLP